MGKFLYLLLKQFIPLLFRGIGFAAIMLITTLFAIFRGMWEQSDQVAIAWLNQIALARIYSPFSNPQYWLIRFAALSLMIICLLVMSHFLNLLLLWILRLW